MKGGRGKGAVLESQNPKCQDLPKFQFFFLGGGKSKSKVQDLPKFEFTRGGGLVVGRWGLGRVQVGVFWKVKDLPKFQIWMEEGGSGKSKPKMPRSVQISIGGGGGDVLNQIPKQGCSEQFGQKYLEA